MADPVVHITNGIPDLGTGNITTLGQTLTDGANATLGAIADSAIVAGAAGTINAHLRSISRDIAAGIVLQGGANNIGSVSQGGAPWSQNVSQFGGAAVVTGTGVSGAGIPRVTVSSDSSLAATQSGAWDIRNITGSQPLPTGASTSAKQPNFGTAGTPSSDILTVQGVSGMTAVKVDGTGGTFPVSGTIAATQSGTWNITNVSGTVSLPTGAATAAKQPAPSTAGSPSADVLTVQGASGMTALKTNIFGNSGGTLDFAGQNASGSINSQLVGGQFNTTPTTITTGNFSPLQLDSAGNLLVNIKAGAGSGGTASNFGSSFPASGTAVGAKDSAGTNMQPLNLDASGNLKVNVAAGGASGGTSSSFGSAVPGTGTAAGWSDGTNMQMPRVFDADTGAGFQYVPGVLLKKPASGGSVDFGTSSDPIRVDPTGTTTQPVSGTFWQTTQPVSLTSTTITGTVAVTESGTWTVQPGNTANTTPWLMTINQGGNSAAVTAGNALKVDGSAATQPVSGTFWQATQPVSAAALPLPSGAATSANQPTAAALGSTTSGQTGHLALGAVTTAAPTYTTGQTNALSLTTSGLLRVDGSAVTQPVSGTVTVQQSTAGNLKVDLSGTAANATAIKVDGSSVTQPVSGTVSAAQSGTWTVQPGNTANTTPWLVTPKGFQDSGGTDITDTTNHALKVNIVAGAGSGGTASSFGSAFPGQGTAIGVKDSAGTNMTFLQVNASNALKVDGSAVTQPVSGTFWQATQPVSGTVTANIGTSGSLALESGGNLASIKTDVDNLNLAQASATSGQKGNLVLAAATTGAPSYTTGQSNPLSVNLSGGLRVDGSGVTQPVSGTFWQATQPVSGIVTANIGTSGSLALESGGNLASIKTDVDNLNLAQGSTTSGQKGNLGLGAVTTAAPSYTTAQSSPLSLTTAGALRVDGSAVTQPVSGTFWQATQPVSGTVTASQGGTWNVTNISGTISLPTGAATSANQPSNAGQGSTTSGQTGNLVMGAVTTGNPTYTTAQTSPLSLDTSGALRVNVIAGSGGGGTSSSYGSAFPATGTAIGVKDSAGTNMTFMQVNASNALKVDGSAVTQPVSTPPTVTTGTTWNSSTTLNTTLAFNNNPSMLGHVATTSTITAGALTFEESYDNGTTWVSTPAGRLVDPSTGVQIANPYTLVASTNKPFQIISTGTTNYRVRLSTAITGTGSASFVLTSSPLVNEVQVSSVNAATMLTSARVTGNTGAALDFAGQNATSPANSILIGGQFNTTPTTITSGNSSPLQVNAGGILIADAQQRGNWTARCVGNAGGTYDFASTQNVTTPGNCILIGGEFNTTPTTIASGNSSPLQLDASGNVLVSVKATVTQGVAGDVASGSSDSGNPVKSGGQARTTNPTAVSDGQRVSAIFDKLGKQVVVGAVRDLKGVQTTSITAGTETTVVTAGAAGVFNDVYGIVCSNTSATAVNVAFKDSTGGTTRVTIMVPAGDVRGMMLPVDSAMVQATAANNWTATVSTGVTSMLITMLYVKNT